MADCDTYAGTVDATDLQCPRYDRRFNDKFSTSHRHSLQSMHAAHVNTGPFQCEVKPHTKDTPRGEDSKQFHAFYAASFNGLCTMLPQNVWRQTTSKINRSVVARTIGKIYCCVVIFRKMNLDRSFRFAPFKPALVVVLITSPYRSQPDARQPVKS